MEGAAVAQVCHEMGGIPSAIIRVISDQADHSAAVDFLRFVDEVAEYLTGGIVQSLLHALLPESKALDPERGQLDGARQQALDREA